MGLYGMILIAGHDIRKRDPPVIAGKEVDVIVLDSTAPVGSENISIMSVAETVQFKSLSGKPWNVECRFVGYNGPVYCNRTIWNKRPVFYSATIGMPYRLEPSLACREQTGRLKSREF